MSKKDNKDHRPDQENQSIKEQAINHKEVQGKQINQQELQRNEQHQPRDKA